MNGKVPSSKFLWDMGIASIVGGVILLMLSKGRKIL